MADGPAPVLLIDADPAVTGDRDVRLLTLNRPEVKNALNLPIRQAIADAVRDIVAEGSARVIVIAGASGNFAAGADVRLLAGASAREVEQLDLQRYWAALAACPVPIIAAIEGFALGGGCELALNADLLIASETAMLGFPEIKLGIMPGSGGTQRLARAVGRARALRLLLTGETITGATAGAWGLVSDAVAEGTALAVALGYARTIARMPRQAAAAIKRAVHDGADLPLADAMALERRLFISLFDTADQKEGMAAFLDKRRARFEGRDDAQ
jgi:enoyl-CoA hydratase/carnithine racemase